MTRGYKFIVAALAGITFFATLGMGAYFGSLYSPYHKQYDAIGGGTSTTTTYQGVTQSLPEISGVPDPVERAIANPPPKTGKDHEKRDLAAQEAMSVWGFWMAIFAGLTVIITLTGTALIWRQVELTRKAVQSTNDATVAMNRQNEIAEAAQRPWVGVEIVNVSMSSSKEVLELTVNILLRNQGKTPALAIRSWARIISGHGEQTKEGDLFPEGEYTRIVHNLMPGGSGHNSLHPKASVDRIAMMTVFLNDDLVAGPQVVPRLEIKVEYQWGEPLQKGKTVQVFSISEVDEIYHKRDERLSIPIVLGTVPIPPLKAIELASPEIS